MAFFVELGFRTEFIYPADEPKECTMSGLGTRIRLAPTDETSQTFQKMRIYTACKEQIGRVVTAPNGTTIEFIDADPPVVVPMMSPQFVLTTAQGGPKAGVGRAGMVYRDLIPGRLGGKYIASSIAIPEGGPVADWVHFHKIRFQMIFCHKGWVKIAYEDQGPAFILREGDFVLQPPRIRHKVLESSQGLEVVEISSPATHETIADHEMELPTGKHAPDRDFSGQTFLRHISDECTFQPEQEGFLVQNSLLHKATQGLADTQVIKNSHGKSYSPKKNTSELVFVFLLSGTAELNYQGSKHAVSTSDTFVIPPTDTWQLSNCSQDLSWLQVKVMQ